MWPPASPMELSSGQAGLWASLGLYTGFEKIKTGSNMYKQLIFYVNKKFTSYLHKLSILQLQTIFCKKVMLQQTKTFLKYCRLSNFSFRRVRGWRGGVGDNSSAVTYFFYPLFGGGLVDAPQIGQSYLLLLVLVFFLLTKVKQHTESELVGKVKEGQRSLGIDCWKSGSL